MTSLRDKGSACLAATLLTLHYMVESLEQFSLGKVNIERIKRIRNLQALPEERAFFQLESRCRDVGWIWSDLPTLSMVHILAGLSLLPPNLATL